MSRFVRLRNALRACIARLFSPSGPSRRLTVSALAASTAAFNRARVKTLFFQE